MRNLAKTPKQPDRRVRGHTCRGLREHFDAAQYPSVPSFSPSGAIVAADDINAVVIRFCPFCGHNLATPPETRSAPC
jgi:hypothetical protein